MEIKIPDALAAGLLAALGLNFAIADWRLNPLWDLVYVRVTGPFLYGNHALIGLLAVGIAFYLSRRNGRILFAMITVFSIIGLHELIIQAESIPLYGWTLVEPQVFTNYQYILWACIISFIVFSNKTEKKAFLVTTIAISLYFFAVFSIYYLQDFRPITLVKFSPGPDYWNLEANLVEDAGWVVALLTPVTMMSRLLKEGLENKNGFIPVTPAVGLMVSVVQKIVRRVEAGTWIEDRIKEGRTKGSWEHIKQSDKISLKAWFPPKSREE